MFSYIIAFLFTTFTSAIISERRYPLDITVLHNTQKNNKHTDPYLHTTRFFDAIHSGKSGFTHNEIKDQIDKTINYTYESLSNQALYNTSTVTTFFNNNYYSLDNPVVSENIESIDINYIIDCNINNNINVGDYYVGSSKSSHKDIKSYSNHGSTKGFIFSRLQ
jgi:hypothetical protein